MGLFVMQILVYYWLLLYSHTHTPQSTSPSNTKSLLPENLMNPNRSAKTSISFPKSLTFPLIKYPLLTKPSSNKKERMRKTTYFPDEVLEHIFNYLESHKDRNNLSLVCKTWYEVERFSRQRVLISNCYSLVPHRLITRFPNLRVLTLKGRPPFDWVPLDWGGFVLPWIEALANHSTRLEQVKLKRMVVSDQDLELISHSFPKFKGLVLVNCHGFTTEGLATIAANCRLLEVLDVQGNEVEDNRGEWLSCFPESCTSLVSLNFACLKGQVDLVSLERLVARCPNLRILRLNKAVPFDMLHKILARAPQLVELGIGSYVQVPNSEVYVKLRNAVLNCQSLQTLSGFLEVTPQFLPVIYPICSNLNFLNLSCTSGIPDFELIKLVRQCLNLHRLWILDSIGDKGLEVVASTCKVLEELRIFPSDLFDVGYSPITEEGLVAISMGCPKIHSLLYLCRQMTNAALITVARNCPKITCFRLRILDSSAHDHCTLRPLDEGFGAIVQSCKELRQLAISGLLTDQVFLYIGMYAEQLETFSVDSAGGSDTGMLYVLNGCRNLRKLEIRNCPFGDAALQADAINYETINLLWMSSRKITLGGCMALARKVPMLNVEIINEMDPIEENPDEGMAVEKMYLYRTLDGPRKDAPESVWIL